MPSTLNQQTSPQVSAPIPAEPGRFREGWDVRLDAARQRLRAALGALDAAVSRHNEKALEQADQRTEYAALQEDRSRLAVDLDAAIQRTRALESANAEASRRVERATAAVRAVLDADSTRERSADAEAAAETTVEDSQEA